MIATKREHNPHAASASVWSPGTYDRRTNMQLSDSHAPPCAVHCPSCEDAQRCSDKTPPPRSRAFVSERRHTRRLPRFGAGVRRGMAALSAATEKALWEARFSSAA